jgi:hypothetical protein
MAEQIPFEIHEISDDILSSVPLGTDHSNIRPFSAVFIITYLSSLPNMDDDLEIKRQDETTINVSSQKYSNIENNYTSCSICLEEFNQNDEVVLLHCKHVFPDKCIVEWGHYRENCPVCRNNVNKENS